MTKNKKHSLELFTELETEGIQPTGSPWITTNTDDPATVPVPLQVAIVKLEGPFNEKDRKLWTFLLHAVFDELGEKQIHSLSVRDINNVFRQLGGEHDHKWIWESAKRLAKTTIEWEATLNDERVLGVASIFGASLTPNAKQSGRLDFFFPPNLIPIIKHPLRFARVRVHFMMKLSGKYAVTLYEILEGYANRRDGQCRVTIKELRTWLKVAEGKYKVWKDFRKWVLDPAIKQINDDPLGAGFTVKYEAKRKGRSYNEIIFTLEKTNPRKQKDYKIQRAAQDGRSIAQAKNKNRPVLLQSTIDEAAHLTNNALNMDNIEKQFWDYWESQGCQEFKNGVASVFIGFTKRKYSQFKDIGSKIYV